MEQGGRIRLRGAGRPFDRHLIVQTILLLYLGDAHPDARCKRDRADRDGVCLGVGQGNGSLSFSGNSIEQGAHQITEGHPCVPGLLMPAL